MLCPKVEHCSSFLVRYADCVRTEEKALLLVEHAESLSCRSIFRLPLRCEKFGQQTLCLLTYLEWGRQSIELAKLSFEVDEFQWSSENGPSGSF